MDQDPMKTCLDGRGVCRYNDSPATTCRGYWFNSIVQKIGNPLNFYGTYSFMRPFSSMLSIILVRSDGFTILR